MTLFRLINIRSIIKSSESFGSRNFASPFSHSSIPNKRFHAFVLRNGSQFKGQMVIGTMTHGGMGAVFAAVRMFEARIDFFDAKTIVATGVWLRASRGTLA